MVNFSGPALTVVGGYESAENETVESMCFTDDW